MAITSIAVFAGTSSGSETAYSQAAKEMGKALASRGIALVYGGGGEGLGGELAKAALAAGGQVTGVMPRFLVEKGRALPLLKDLHVARDLHEHKAIMAELADGFVALPGGLGTLEEFFEIVTWAQLSLHCKPCGLLNVMGYFDQLLSFMDHVQEKAFVSPANRSLILSADTPAEILDLFQKFSSGS